jgi:glycosyltransferase involved in cell wall biosynthesis
VSFSVNLPFNKVSFGQVSTLLMRGLYGKGVHPCAFPIAQTDLAHIGQDKPFMDYLSKCLNKAHLEHDRNKPTFKLWHLNDSLPSYSKISKLLTFYELDQPTPTEINISKNIDKLFFTNKYTQDVFEQYGVESTLIPLPFDKHSFKVLNKKYFEDDRIVFNLCGKFEKRKHHEKIIKAWANKFGNNKKYYLQCAVYNTFIDAESNKQNFIKAVDGKSYSNIQFLGDMPTNSLYNDFLNSSDIIIGMSGGEGWGLPEFQSLALGKHGVIMNAHAYKEWATEENSIMVEPSGKIEAYDGVFFAPNQAYNQGNIFDFKDDDFISACEEAIKRVELSRVNEEGLKIQKDFSLEKTIDKLLPLIDE